VVVEVTSDAALYFGHHGYPNDDPQLDGIFIAYGYGVKAGVTVERMSNLSVAPTVARFLNVPLPTAEGQPLNAIFK